MSSVILKKNKEVELPENAVIYADPPYVVRKYYSSGNMQEDFNMNEFWEYCRNTSQKNKIFISCYFPPEDAIILWKKQINCDLSKNTVVLEKQIKTEYLVTF